MLVIFANDQVYLNQKEYKISDLVNNISTLSGQQLADFFITRKVPLFREIRIQALRYVLNQKMINVKNLTLTDAQKHALSKYPYLSEYQLEEFFNLLADEVAFVQYKKKLIELIILNNTALELTDDELIKLNETYSINPNENFARFQKSLFKGVKDNPTHFDGLRYDRFKVVATHTFTDEDVQKLASKYGVDIQTPLNKQALLKFIINDLMEKNLWKDNLYDKLNNSEINELDSFAALKSIKISSNPKKDDLIAYIVKSRKYTRAYAHNEYIPIQVTDDLKKYKIPIDTTNYLKNNSIGTSRLKEFAKEIDKTEFTRRQVDAIKKEIEDENRQVEDWNKFLITKGFQIPISSMPEPVMPTTPVVNVASVTPTLTSKATLDTVFPTSAPAEETPVFPQATAQSDAFAAAFDNAFSNNSVPAGGSAFDALNLNQNTPGNNISNNTFDAFNSQQENPFNQYDAMSSTNSFDTAYASAFGQGQSPYAQQQPAFQEPYAQHQASFQDSYDQQQSYQEPYSQVGYQEPYSQAGYQDPYTQQPLYQDSHTQQHAYESFDQGYHSLQSELTQMANQMKRTQEDFRKTAFDPYSSVKAQNSSKTYEFLVKQYSELLMASEAASQLNQQTINNFERKVTQLESQLSNYDSVAATRLSTLKSELERTRMQAIDTESSLRKELEMTQRRYAQNEDILRKELENQKRFGVDHLLILEEKLKSEKRQRLLYERMLSRNEKNPQLDTPTSPIMSNTPKFTTYGQPTSLYPTQDPNGFGGYSTDALNQMYSQSEASPYSSMPYASTPTPTFDPPNMMNSIFQAEIPSMNDPYAMNNMMNSGMMGNDIMGNQAFLATPFNGTDFGQMAANPFGQATFDPAMSYANPADSQFLYSQSPDNFAYQTPNSETTFNPYDQSIPSFNDPFNNNGFNIGALNQTDSFKTEEANMATSTLRTGQIPSVSIFPHPETAQSVLGIEAIVETQTENVFSEVAPVTIDAQKTPTADLAASALDNKISRFNADELDADYDQYFKKSKKGKFRFTIIMAFIIMALIPLIIGFLYEIFDDINVIISIYEMLSPILGPYMGLGRLFANAILSVLG